MKHIKISYSVDTTI